mmetsp:Transcript_26557/g.53142  ORF Transcript_26557/g.53142 Transcript_26557/m.53142 type:complete len:345 (-) Transcript_26557:168-1202(-)
MSSPVVKKFRMNRRNSSEYGGARFKHLKIMKHVHYMFSRACYHVQITQDNNKSIPLPQSTKHTTFPHRFIFRHDNRKNIHEAKQQIEGTVRMQMTDTTPRQSTSGMNYRDKLQQMKAPRGGGGKAENVASSAQHATAQSASFPPPPPPATPAASDFSQYQQQLQQQPQYQQYQQPRPQQQYQPPPPQTQQPPQPQRFQHQPVAPDPIQGSVASVETVLKMYKEASPEEREALMIPLREALLAAAGASNAAIEGNPSGMGMMPAPPVASAGVSFPRTASAPTSMAATRSGDTFDENTRRLEEVYEALGDAAGKGKFGLRNLSGAEAEELASAVGAMRTVLLDELN